MQWQIDDVKENGEKEKKKREREKEAKEKQAKQEKEGKEGKDGKEGKEEKAQKEIRGKGEKESTLHPTSNSDETVLLEDPAED